MPELFETCRRAPGPFAGSLAALAALLVSVSAAANPFKAELLRRACNEYVVAYTAQEAIESSADWNDPSKVPTMNKVREDAWSRLRDAEQKVVNHLPDEQIDRLSVSMRSATRAVAAPAGGLEPVFLAMSTPKDDAGTRRRVLPGAHSSPRVDN